MPALLFERLLAQTVTATADITAGQPVTLTGAVAAAGASILGIATDDIANGDDGPAMVLGMAVVTADGTVTAGDDIEVGTSGKYRTLASGVKIGRALSSAASGDSFVLFVLATSDPTGVTSFNSRTGAVAPTTGDYTASQVTNAVSTASTYTDPSWLTALNGSKITGSVAGNLAWATVPPTHSSPGTAGQIAYDGAGNLYVCYALNQWAKYSPSSISF